MRKRVQLLAKSFQYAFSGIQYVFRTQQNARIHAIFTALVVAIGFWLNLPNLHWAILILTIALVWAAECLNTAIEMCVNLASPSLHPFAKISKDASAGAVFITAFSSVMIGCLIIIPPFLQMLF